MPRLLCRLLAAASLAAMSLVAAACGPALPEGPGVPPELEKVVRLGEDAQASFQAGDWADAAVKFQRQVDAAGDDPHLAGWRDQALYNLACVHARAGRKEAAAKTFALSIAEGLRAPMVADVNGNWGALGRGLTLPHILSDPDLDSMRDEAAYRDALRPYLDGGGAGLGWVVTDVGAPAGAARPVIVAMTALNVRVVQGSQPTMLVPTLPEPEAWRLIAGERGFRFVDARGPICDDPPAERLRIIAADSASPPRPFRRWLLEDGDDRWAVAHLARVVDGSLLAAGAEGPGAAPADADRVYLFAEGHDAATAAWAAALAMPERVAGICAVGAAFHREAWADALAAVPSKRAGKAPWTVLVGSMDGAAAEAMKSIGIDVVRITPGEAPKTLLAAAIPR